MFCMFPDSQSEWKKGATGQSFIWKEITTYRIGTLIVQIIFIVTLQAIERKLNSLVALKFHDYESK